MKQLKRVSNIKTTKQLQERRKNPDETTKNNIKAENTKQHQQRRKKNLLKQLKRVSKMKMQSNITRERKILMN